MADASLTIYEWAGDYMCSGCIVRAMLDTEPWFTWTDTYDNREFTNTNAALRAMARHFKLRTDEDKEQAGFPTLVTPANDTIFCSICLNLLHHVP